LQKYQMISESLGQNINSRFTFTLLNLLYY